jgi:PD-(D/E)XK nuclease superfamily protein
LTTGNTGEARTSKDCDERLIDSVLTCVTNVHRNLGPGLFESVYELAAMLQFEQAHILAKHQVEIPVCYQGQDLGIGFNAKPQEFEIRLASSALLPETKDSPGYSIPELKIALTVSKAEATQ